MSQTGRVMMSRPLIARTLYLEGFFMNGENTPCMPSLVPVVQLAQPGKLFGRIVERSGALTPSRMSRDRTGNRPALASGLMRSNVAPSSPIIAVFILRFWISDFGFTLSLWKVANLPLLSSIQNPKSKIENYFSVDDP